MVAYADMAHNVKRFPNLQVQKYTHDFRLRQSWVTSARCVFLNNVIIIRPNTIYRSSTIVVYYTLKHISAVQINHC